MWAVMASPLTIRCDRPVHVSYRHCTHCTDRHRAHTHTRRFCHRKCVCVFVCVCGDVFVHALRHIPITHLTLHCPSLLCYHSGNVRNMTSTNLETYLNSEVIAVNQDPMGRQGVRLVGGDLEVNGVRRSFTHTRSHSTIQIHLPPTPPHTYYTCTYARRCSPA